MKKSKFFIVRKLLPVFLLCITLACFLWQTKEAISAINFHADIFEKQERNQNEIILLDAGHGGEDGGAVGINGVNEKDINFAITLILKEKLEKEGFQVILTRDEDNLIGDNTLGSIAERKRSDTQKRLKLIEEYPECTFISVHQNHFSESKYFGAQVFYSSANPNSAKLAESIRNEIVGQTQPENKRENKAAEKNIYILYNTTVPAVLVECGFISNQNEADLLIQSDYQNKMAEAICDGIITYFDTKNNVQQDNQSSLNP